MGNAGVHRQVQCLAIHVGDHEHLARRGVRGDTHDEAACVEARA